MTPYVNRRECAICFSSQYSDTSDSPERFYSTPCNHHFHFECLQRWCLTNNNCPTCRLDTVMNLPNNINENLTIDEIYSIYVNNDRNNNETSSSIEDEQAITSQNNDNLNNEHPLDNNNNFSIVDIDSILDNIRNHYNNTGVIRSNNVMSALNLTRTTYSNSWRQNNNNYNYVNNIENYLLRDRYRNLVNQNIQRINEINITNNQQIIENNYITANANALN
jgi:hypothetical protein